MAKVDIVGIPGALARVDKLGGIFNTKDAKEAFVAAAWVIAKIARRLAPFNARRKKGTHLRDAITVTPGPLAYTDAFVTVRYRRPGAPHAHLVEFGTSRTPPHPYLRPAAVAGAREAQAVLAARLGVAILRALGGR